MRPFNLLLREPRVIAAELIKLYRQRRVVAGVTEDDSAQLSVRRFDAQRRNLAINHTFRVDADDDAVRIELPAVHRKRGSGSPEGELRRRQIFDRFADDLAQAVYEPSRVIVNERGLRRLDALSARHSALYH